MEQMLLMPHSYATDFITIFTQLHLFVEGLSSGCQICMCTHTAERAWEFTYPKQHLLIGTMLKEINSISRVPLRDGAKVTFCRALLGFTTFHLCLTPFPSLSPVSTP